jgi:hypothetical protein
VSTRGHRRRGRTDRGMVSAELALALPALLVVLALCLAGLGLAVDQVRCADAARVAARAASRGEPHGRVVELARELAPSGSRIGVAVEGTEVLVTVEAPPRTLLVGGPAASGRAVVPLEPGAGSAG